MNAYLGRRGGLVWELSVPRQLAQTLSPQNAICHSPWDLKPRHPIYLPFLRSWELTLWAPQLVIPPAQNSSHQLPPPGNCTNLALSRTHTNHSHLWAVFFLQKKKIPKSQSPLFLVFFNTLSKNQNHGPGSKGPQPLACGLLSLGVGKYSGPDPFTFLRTFCPPHGSKETET